MPAPIPTRLRPAPADEAAGIEPLLGCTLTLLTLYARTPSLDAADAIARNLAHLARHPAVPAPLQGVCTRLFLDWLGPLEVQDGAADSGWRTVHDAPARTQ